jgi:hypothetical protein
MCGSDGAHAVRANLIELWPAECDCVGVEGVPLWAERLAAGTVKWQADLGHAKHGKLGSSSSGKECGTALSWACAWHAQRADAGGESDVFLGINKQVNC